MTNENNTARKLRGEPGDLRKLLTRGLPELCVDGILDIHALAARMGISYQAVYAWFKRDLVSRKRIKELCELSHSTELTNRPATMLVNTREAGEQEVIWAPLTPNDFWEFMDD